MVGVEDVVGGIRISFSLCAVGAIVVGLFLVYNALSVSVAERRHDIGILRSAGATRLQIGRLFAAESVVMGFTGSLLGIPLGIGLADLALDQFREELSSAFLSTHLSPLSLSWLTIAYAFIAGLGVSLFAALVRDMSGQVRDHVAPDIEGAADEVDRERLALASYLRFVLDHKEVYRIIDEAEFVDPAGFRTHTVVALGSAIFTVVSGYAFTGPGADPTRIAAQIVSGIGFIGAGTILHSRGQIRGLTTAASLWAVAGIGMAAGAGLFVTAGVGTFLMLITLSVLDRVEDYARRRIGLGPDDNRPPSPEDADT